ncbi:MAG TPA: DUF2116 family Zn-ribbon domain-containing protein [Thermoplasmatales archaeon]|nr:DUF2116 family Zn-ribbon domain-containing protein [Thermoplasmatales archaeon]
MTETISQHRHCQMCGKAVPLEETFCSEECKQNYQQFLKKRRRLILIMYLLLILAIFFFFALSQI